MREEVGRRRRLTAAEISGLVVVMSGVFLGALDHSIVSTAMPTVVGELGGIEQYALVFSVYLLVSTVTTPLVGRLADAWGRKPIYLAGLLAFTLASLGAGLSASMEQLIAARALQGLGAGVLLPIGMTIAGDLFDTRTRARIQPLFSSMWVVAALVGPSVGGVLTQTLSWRWAFLINLPVGIVGAVLLLIVFKERRSDGAATIAWSGATTFTIAVGALLLALGGGPSFLWVISAGALAAFVWFERRTAAPFLDLSLLRSPTIGAGVALIAVAGGLMFALTTYLPPFVQGVQGGLPIEAGVVVSVSSLGWTASSVTMSFVLIRLGPRLVATVGTTIWIVASAILVMLEPASPLVLVGLGATLLGIGMGMIVNPIVISAQSQASWSERGTVTGLVFFSRSLGSAMNVAVLGSLMLLVMGPIATAEASALLARSLHRDAVAVDEATRASLAQGLHAVFVAMLLLSLLGPVLARRLPRRLIEPVTDRGETSLATSATE